MKIWSTNNNYVKPAKKLFDEGVYDYIELFAVPDSFNDTIGQWQSLKKIPFVIHAAHSTVGFNPAKAECFQRNLELAEEAFGFSDKLSADTIIFHPGCEGKIEETINQFKIIKTKYDTQTNKMIVENKPYYGKLDDKPIICNGYNPIEIQRIMIECSIGFCLDIGHAIYAANALKQNPFDFLDEFYKLSPRMYHFSDGNINGVDDTHWNIGKGNFDFSRILKHIPKESKISLETEKASSKNLDDFVKDVNNVKDFINEE
ncbi:MAG: sugar phosphate isomerase/epimerase [Planctomycetaceae bacterium]|nr:sugar phosphate isomerase/epimerase [Planctomycetaceae bacterium]